MTPTHVRGSHVTHVRQHAENLCIMQAGCQHLALTTFCSKRVRTSACNARAGPDTMLFLSPAEKKQNKSLRFSDHNGSLLRQQPGACHQLHKQLTVFDMINSRGCAWELTCTLELMPSRNTMPSGEGSSPFMYCPGISMSSRLCSCDTTATYL